MSKQKKVVFFSFVKLVATKALVFDYILVCRILSEQLHLFIYNLPDVSIVQPEAMKSRKSTEPGVLLLLGQNTLVSEVVNESRRDGS